MKKVIGYPCPKCKHLEDGKVLIYQYVSDNLIIVRFKMDKCHVEFVQFWNKQEVARYVKEVKDET